MLVLIRLHNRPVPALFIPILNLYIVGGDMLRMRAIYIYKTAKDFQGMPTLGYQLGHFIVSAEDTGLIRIAVLIWHKRFTVQFGILWNWCYKTRFIGGLKVYKLYNAIKYALLNPSRNEYSYIPRWDIEQTETKHAL